MAQGRLAIPVAVATYRLLGGASLARRQIMNEKLRTFFAARKGTTKHAVNGANYAVSYDGITSVPPAALKTMVFERFDEMSAVTTETTAPNVK